MHCTLHYYLTTFRVKGQFLGIYFLEFKKTLFPRLDNGQVGVNMTGGPLQYQYQAEQLFLHWGREGI